MSEEKPRRLLKDEEDEDEAKPRRVEEGWGNTPLSKPLEAQPKRRAADEEDTEVVIIPDLDEQAEEDIAFKVAEAPRNVTRKLPTLEELDAALVGMVPPVTVKKKRLDIGILTETLVPSQYLDEGAEPWTFDALLQEVSQEFVKDAERDAEVEKLLKNMSLKLEEKTPLQEAGDRLRRRPPKGGRRAPKKKKDQNPDDDDDKPQRPPPKGGRRAVKAPAPADTSADTRNEEEEEEEEEEDTSDEDEAPHK
ncbi:hypothetical protein CTAYLR_006919 [Chrysophaeum taylorii]|uniref:Uncharacterized protein n=1 Tax=Chrysophaeum taylorii TaxID=2483200 RepID=A0AAD7UBG0_9STRA|nr:hypothetical protein CTAYLR_006919 [Chrysophaeum taylorii]